MKCPMIYMMMIIYDLHYTIFDLCTRNTSGTVVHIITDDVTGSVCGTCYKNSELQYHYRMECHPRYE